MAQGEDPTHAYIVQDGEFEILRNRKTNYHLMDPLTHNKFTDANKLKTDQIAKLLKNAG